MPISSAAAIRKRLDHPVIDIDGHTMESLPALTGYLRQEGVDPTSPRLRRLLPALSGSASPWSELSQRERARQRSVRPPWWGSPTRNTRDLATALFPKLMYERMDELGIDFSVAYPSIGLIFMHLEDEQERRGTCRALNRCNADAFRDFADRLTPVAAISMNTPQEAVEDLDYAVSTLGFKAVLLAGYVQRPIEAANAANSRLGNYATWLDFYGIDSAYDYDPVWAKCQELGVAVSFHSGSIGWGSRQSISNYMYNHIGHLAEGQHALAKSLFFGGVTRRFPALPFAFLEGGVAWAAALYSDLIGHWEKRNIDALKALDPDGVDGRLFAELQSRYGPVVPDDAPTWQRPREDPAMLDEWERCRIERAEDIRDLFVPNFFFGCEADDPMTTAAFRTKVNPFGARLQAMFGSDISHWDVPEMSEVLEEAREMVDHEMLTETDFRDFVFTNPVRYFTRTNPNFFQGTAVESAVGRFLEAGGQKEE